MSLMRPITSIRSDFDRLFSDLEREFFAPNLKGRRAETESCMSLWSPPVNVKESEKDVIVTASIPGMKPEDITVEVEGNMLTIAGASKTETEDKNENYYRREITQGSFHRQIQLPTEVEGEKAKALFEQGMLDITIPKSPSTQRHKVSISS